MKKNSIPASHPNKLLISSSLLNKTSKKNFLPILLSSNKIINFAVCKHSCISQVTTFLSSYLLSWIVTLLHLHLFFQIWIYSLQTLMLLDSPVMWVWSKLDNLEKFNLFITILVTIWFSNKWISQLFINKWNNSQSK